MRILIILVLLGIPLGVVHAQETPTPAPTVTPVYIPDQTIYEGLTEGDDLLNEVDGSLTAPDGSNLLPSFDPTALFGYIKWVVSPGAADELAGPFAGFFSHLGFFLVIRFTLLAIYTIIWVIAWLIQFALRLFRLIMQFIGLLVDILNALTSAIGGLISKFIGFFTG